jgi:DNA polymerase V
VGGVVLERVVRELRGTPCLGLELVPPARKGLAVTRSFGRPLGGLDEIAGAVAAHAARAGEKLRAHGLVAGQLTVFLLTDHHRPGPQRQGAGSTRLTPMTDDTRDLAAAARRCVEVAWRDGFAFVRAGVILDDLRAGPHPAPTLFEAPRPGSAALAAAVDALNARFGRGAVLPAAALVGRRAWEQRAARRSPRYTTRLDELPVVVA